VEERASALPTLKEEAIGGGVVLLPFYNDLKFLFLELICDALKKNYQVVPN
jgi:hypothetical protein